MKKHFLRQTTFLRKSVKLASILAIGCIISACEKKDEPEPLTYNLHFRNFPADDVNIGTDTIETIRIYGTGFEAQMPVTLNQFSEVGDYYTIRDSKVESSRELKLQFITNRGEISMEQLLENPVESNLKRVTYFLTVQEDLTLKTETQIVKR